MYPSMPFIKLPLMVDVLAGPLLTLQRVPQKRSGCEALVYPTTQVAPLLWAVTVFAAASALRRTSALIRTPEPVSRS